MNPKTTYSITLVLFLAVGCSTIPFSELFPLQYPDDKSPPYQADVVSNYLKSNGVDKFNVSKGLPDDVVAALPTEFGLAYEAGYLIAVFDDGGGMGKTHLWHRKVRNSQQFDKTVAALSRLDYERFEPPGYPNVVCFRPKGDAMQLIDEGWFADWVAFVAKWDSDQFEIDSIAKANQSFVGENFSASQAIAAADAEMTRLGKEIQITTDKANDAERRLNELRSVRITADREARPAKPIPPFDPKRPYDKKDDFFEPVLKDYLEDTSKREWSIETQHQFAFEYLDPDFAAELDKMNQGLKTPDKLPADIQKSLKDAGNNGQPFKLQVKSSTRTPMGQAYVPSGKNPKGSYIGSDHLFGQATDIIHSHAWGSDGFKAVQKVVGHFGFHFSVVNDQPHITLTSPTSKMAARRLAIARGYSNAAQRAALGQSGAKADRVFEQNKLIEKKTQLAGDLEGKRKEIEKLQSLFTKVSARHLQFQTEIQAEQERIREQQRQKEERERQERERRERERNRRDPSDRWDRLPREPRQPDPPRAEPKAPRESAPRERSPRERAPRERSTPKEPTVKMGRLP